MVHELLKAIPVYLLSMVKFIFGPVGGYTVGLNLLTTILTTVAGMMTVVVAIAFFGDWVRKKILNRYFPNRKRFSERNRKFVTIWRKYGIIGVAILTPLILTPLGGSLLAVSFGSPRDKLMVYMFISASVWSVALSFAVYLFGDTIVPMLVSNFPDFLKP